MMELRCLYYCKMFDGTIYIYTDFIRSKTFSDGTPIDYLV